MILNIKSLFFFIVINELIDPLRISIYLEEFMLFFFYFRLTFTKFLFFN